MEPLSSVSIHICQGKWRGLTNLVGKERFNILTFKNGNTTILLLRFPRGVNSIIGIKCLEIFGTGAQQILEASTEWNQAPYLNKITTQSYPNNVLEVKTGNFVWDYLFLIIPTDLSVWQTNKFFKFPKSINMTFNTSIHQERKCLNILKAKEYHLAWYCADYSTPTYMN